METNQEPKAETKKTKKTKTVMGVLIFLIIVFVLAYTQLTIFVIQPLGALPEGKTIIIPKTNKTKFIDSADALCERKMGGVSLICRAMTIGLILNNEDMPVLLKLPYSKTLYLISTNGKTYDH